MVRVISGAEDCVFRSGGRNETVRKLRIGDVIHHFGEQLREIKFVAQRWPVEVIFLEPAKALAMRAIGHHAHHVAALRPTNELSDPIEERVGTFEFPYSIAIGVNHRGFKGFYLRQVALHPGPLPIRWGEGILFRIRSKMCLHVSAANVEKSW